MEKAWTWVLDLTVPLTSCGMSGFPSEPQTSLLPWGVGTDGMNWRLGCLPALIPTNLSDVLQL